LRPLPAHSTVAAPENDHRPRSRSVPFSFAGHCASLPPCGVPRSLCQSASSSLLQPTFALRAPEKTSLSETARRAPWEKPADVRHRDRSPALGFRLRLSCGAGPPCGHPASNGCALDGANAGFRSFDSLIPTVTPDFTVLSHTEGEGPRLFRPEAPLSNRTL
jgi:hypothetical protein